MSKLVLAATFLFVFSMFGLSQSSSELTLKSGEQKVSKACKLKVKFIEVLEDSRCPEGVNCIWAGNAKIRISVAKGKAAPTIIELNTGVEPMIATAYGYEFKLLSLDPYPVEGKPKTGLDTAKLSINKQR